MDFLFPVSYFRLGGNFGVLGENYWEMGVSTDCGGPGGVGIMADRAFLREMRENHFLASFGVIF